jgi:hypothetical protein
MPGPGIRVKFERELVFGYKRPSNVIKERF